ncbi:MAG: GGDEF domain-containing protein [Planctomycetota bacterium]|nr:GGDEF domain-containing protein [Planctomycetota bacterium]
MELQLTLLMAACFMLGYLVKSRWGQPCVMVWKDHVTGLPDRSAFERRVKLGLTSRNKMALIIIDLDNFKSVNDQQGHLVGDSLLQEAAHTLLKTTANLGTLFRWGGDEFVVLIDESPMNLLEVCTQIEKQFDAADLGLSCSTGSTEQQTNDTAATFFERADLNLYSNKS